jgi:hypothetical protein
MKIRFSQTILMLTLMLSGCQRTEEFVSAGEISVYQPFRIGSSVTYRLDSTVYASNLTSKTVRTHVIRLVTDATVTDGMGRTAWRIIRSIRDPYDSTRWIPEVSFLAIPTTSTLEWIEQNQRFILMSLPIRDGFSWGGNRFINTVSDPQRQYLDGWAYTWKSVGSPHAAGDRIFQNTATVELRNDSINDARDRTRYFSRDFARDVYAKGVGLIYRERIHEVWQPPNGSSSTGYFEPGSHGIRMTYLSHKESP